MQEYEYTKPMLVPIGGNMKNQLTLALTKIDGNLVKLIILVVSLTLFVLGAGAPAGDGGIGG